MDIEADVDTDEDDDEEAEDGFVANNGELQFHLPAPPLLIKNHSNAKTDKKWIDRWIRQ